MGKPSHARDRASFDRMLSAPDEHGCRTWQGYRIRTGYGSVSLNGRDLRTHRVAWELANGLIPEGLHVLHKCDNPPCCELSHLFLGTHQDNMRDCKQKARFSRKGAPRGDANGLRKRPHRHPAKLDPTWSVGEKNGHAVLTESLVRALRTSSESSVVWAARTGVSRAAISMARNGRTWKHV